MSSNFLPSISLQTIKDVQSKGDDDELFDLFVQPLHAELYSRKTFDFFDDLSDGQQLMLAFDYTRMQVNQGGFIQFIQNGYIGLLPAMIEQLYKIGGDEMAKVLDDVLKVYVLNRDLLGRQTTVEEFAQLYEELKEFEGIDERFAQLQTQTLRLMLDYAVSHLSEFTTEAE